MAMPSSQKVASVSGRPTGAVSTCATSWLSAAWTLTTASWARMARPVASKPVNAFRVSRSGKW